MKSNIRIDFSGYATRYNTKCSDGRVISQKAFLDNDGATVPLVWQHQHRDPANILGKAMLHTREDGVYAECSLNNSESANEIREAIRHGDINNLSIYATRIQQTENVVVHGDIKEVSVVLSGANPGAYIDDVSFAHSGDSIPDEIIIYPNDDDFIKHGDDAENIQHEEEPPVDVKKKDETDEVEMPDGIDLDKTVEEVLDTLTSEQRYVLTLLVSKAIEATKNEELDDQTGDKTNDGENADEKQTDEGDKMKHSNVFEGDDKEQNTLTHSQIEEIFSDAEKYGSLRESVLAHAKTYGFGENVSLLFPDHKVDSSELNLISRPQEWVGMLMSRLHKTPFSRVKSLTMDVTADEARAKGYITGNEKKEEVIKLLKRTTNPTTIYKKQALDHDDLKDITDFNVVQILKNEMEFMLKEELARAILVGDGRSIESEDHVNTDCIRPIATDEDLYTIKRKVNYDPVASPDALIDEVVEAMVEYEGSGNTILFLDRHAKAKLRLLKDKNGRRIYTTDSELASAFGVSAIIDTPFLPLVDKAAKTEVIAIVVDPADYGLGTNGGGPSEFFENFDIDYNKHKYLIETRLSGALRKPKTALAVIKSTATS